MDDKFDAVRTHLVEIGVEIIKEDAEEKLFVVRDEERGISGLIVDCEDDVLVIEQAIFKLNSIPAELSIRLLKMNRELVHGAYALDETGTQVLFRDTLLLQDLDRSELEATINALELGLAQHGSELLKFVESDKQNVVGE
jgi:hypothetical protein